MEKLQLDYFMSEPEDHDEDEDPIIFSEDPIDEDGLANESPLYNVMLNVELNLYKDGILRQGQVIGRSKVESKDEGEYNPNILLNSKLYDVAFDDDDVRQYLANVIAQNMFQQVDKDGYSLTTFNSIINHHKSEDALNKENNMVTTKSGRSRPVKSTEGWTMEVLFNDDSKQWVPLRILKETNPIEVAEYALANGISTEPAFSYWVPFTMRKRDMIISAVTHRVRSTSRKFGVKIPRSMDDVHKFDAENGNDFWLQATNKEIKNIKVAIELLDEGETAPSDWSLATGHMIWDLKLDFTRKARWVKDGHKTPDPDWSTFAGVVSHETVRIALTYAALNDIEVKVADIRNAYLQAPVSERHYVVCGQEFGIENVGRIGLIRRALYGGKSAGHDFWKHLRSCMKFLGFLPCKADPELWMRRHSSQDGIDYWEYVLLYVDDCLCVSNRAESILQNEIGKYFYLKEESIGDPDIYLGNKLRKVTLSNGASAWSFSSSRYVQEAVANVESADKGKENIPKKATAPFPSGCRPELDTSPVLDATEASHYQSLIGILRWIVELGRIDIACEASTMASFQAMPRIGHLRILYHMFAFLRKKHNAELVLDPSSVTIDEGLFPVEDWTNSPYNLEKYDSFDDSPDLLGRTFQLIAYVDADHAGEHGVDQVIEIIREQRPHARPRRRLPLLPILLNLLAPASALAVSAGASQSLQRRDGGLPVLCAVIGVIGRDQMVEGQCGGTRLFGNFRRLVCQRVRADKMVHQPAIG